MEEAYLFIDGGYLRRKHADAMQKVFDVTGALDLQTVHDWFWRSGHRGAIPHRVFYYDCLHDVKRDKESTVEFETRVNAQRLDLEHIQSLEGFHVRRGRLTGTGNNIRQKGVDVLLAVEMLDHAFRKNMDAAFLLAGDADFAPLVEAVTRLGTWVEVYYEPHGAAKELYSAADRGVAITFNDLWSWNTAEFREAHPIPGGQFDIDFTVEMLNAVDAKQGTDHQGTHVTFGMKGDTKEFFLYRHKQGYVTLFTHPHAAILEKYYNELFGPVIWRG